MRTYRIVWRRASDGKTVTSISVFYRKAKAEAVMALWRMITPENDYQIIAE